jgi:hypothetical protein
VEIEGGPKSLGPVVEATEPRGRGGEVVGTGREGLPNETAWGEDGLVPEVREEAGSVPVKLQGQGRAPQLHQCEKVRGRPREAQDIAHELAVDALKLEREGPSGIIKGEEGAAAVTLRSEDVGGPDGGTESEDGPDK